MNKTVKYSIAIIVFCLSFKTAFNQTDTITTSTAKPDSIDVKYDRVYKLFVRENNHEIKHLLKLDLVNISLRMPGLTYEQKLNRNFSLETYLYIYYGNYLFSDNDSSVFYPTLQLKGADFQVFSVGGYQMIKFYNNFKRRERLGKNTNGFSGNYFALKLSEDYSWIDVFNRQKSAANINLENKYHLIPGFSYGIQRRIGNIGYGELSLTANYYPDNFLNSEYSWGLELELKIGFAIESVSSLKNMLKK